MKKQMALFLVLLLPLLLAGCNSRYKDSSAITPGGSFSEAPSSQSEIQGEEGTPEPGVSASREEEILSTMTLEEKVGQLFFVRCRKESALLDIEQYHLGGYILFGKDFEGETKESIQATLARYQSKATVPLLIGVDEEGGEVNRLSRYPAFRQQPFASSQSLYQKGGFELIRSDTKEKAQLLKSLGINVNLAPVCDVSTNSRDFIYRRSFGKSAADTARYATEVVSAMGQEDIGAALKHFPGYGSNPDTHTGIAVDERPYSVFEEQDFLPFQAGIAAGAGSILVSHNIVTAMDKYPASLSPKVHDILRNQLSFTGVIMTDDLYMQAIRQYTGYEEAAVQAVLAGNDLIIATDFDVQIPAVVEAVKSGRIKEEIIDAAVIRVLRWKAELKLIQ